MKKFLSAMLILLIIFTYTGTSTSVMAIQDIVSQKTVQPSSNAKKVEIAFVFDGPNDRNVEVLETFKKTISKSLLPDFIAVYPKDLQFTGNWTKESAIAVSEKAIKSRAWSVISLGYL